MTEPVLETARLILRPTRREDFESWAAWKTDAEAMRFIGGAQPRAAAWRDMLVMAGTWAIQGFGMFSVIEKESGQWMGRLGPWMPEGWPGPEVGWGLTRAAWGKGYATEGAAATIDWAFDVLGWTEVIHSIAAENDSSKAVARRLGSRFLRVEHLPPPFQEYEVEIWGQTREEWRQRRT